MGNTYFGGYEISGRQVTVGARNAYSHSAAVQGGVAPPPPPVPPSWTGPPTPDTLPQSGTFATAQYASSSPGPLQITISPISTVTLAALQAGGITYNNGLFTAASNATLTSYPNIIELATDLTTGLSTNSFPFTLTVTTSSAQPSWIAPPTLLFTFGVKSTQSLLQFTANFDPNSWVFQLDPTSDLLPKGTCIELNGTVTYDGLGPVASDLNIFYLIAPIQQAYALRSTSRGVIRAVSYSTTADLGVSANVAASPIGNVPSGNFGQYSIAQAPDGIASLQLTLFAGITGGGAGGDVYFRFSDDNSVIMAAGDQFFVQFQEYYDAAHVANAIAVNAGWKLIDISGADGNLCAPGGISGNDRCATSCTSEEIVLQNEGARQLAELYNSCTGCAAHGGFYTFAETQMGAVGSGNPNITNTDLYVQNARPAPYCKYPENTTGNLGNCFGLYSGEVITWMVGINIGADDPTPGSNQFINCRVRLWAQRQGQKSSLLCDNLGDTAIHTTLCHKAPGPNINPGWAKIWFNSYTGTANAHAPWPSQSNMWVRNVIVSHYPSPDAT